jgi:hypothetical protein
MVRRKIFEDNCRDLDQFEVLGQQMDAERPSVPRTAF